MVKKCEFNKCRKNADGYVYFKTKKKPLAFFCTNHLNIVKKDLDMGTIFDDLK